MNTEQLLSKYIDEVLKEFVDLILGKVEELENE